MSTVTTSGEITVDMHTRARATTPDSDQVVYDGKTGPISTNGAHEPSAVLGKRLQMMTARFEQNPITSRPEPDAGASSHADTAMRTASADSALKSDNGNAADSFATSRLAEMVQANIASSGEIAVMASANQLPNAAMSFSSSVE